MKQRINELALALTAKAVERRRDLHRHAEVAWTEFRTAALVADTLTALGYEVQAGAEVVAAEGMMGVPSAAELEKHAQRALAQGANPAWVEKMKGGKTGVVGILRTGKPGPTVALRFDIDANDEKDFFLSAHEGEEFIMVMEGIMEISYGKNTYLLEEGDSIYYDSIVPHHVHAYEGQAAKILAVVYTPI